MKPNAEFSPFPKIPRYDPDGGERIIITEKIDGTNAGIFIDEKANVFASSRKRWITVEDDNFGFAKWVKDNENELRKMGHGMHFGEWWGKGIQREYNQSIRRFTLFNTERWMNDPKKPEVCGVVPVLYDGPYDPQRIRQVYDNLMMNGSVVVEGYEQPEGIIIYFPSTRSMQKYTEKNNRPKFQWGRNIPGQDFNELVERARAAIRRGADEVRIPPPGRDDF